MSAAAEAPFVYAFAALLVIAAIAILFVPLLRHTWVFSERRTVFAAVVASLFALSVVAVLVLTSSLADPAYLVPIAAVTVALRVVSPTLLYHRIRDRSEALRSWTAIRILVAAAYVVFAGVLAYDLLEILAGRELVGVATLSEQLAMSAGASILVVRMAFRVRPREAAEWWPVWLAATSFAVAFVIVAPYAFPAFEAAYLVSGLVGWIVGVLVIRFVD